MYKIQFHHHRHGWYDHADTDGAAFTFATQDDARACWRSIGWYDERSRIVPASQRAEWVRP